MKYSGKKAVYIDDNKVMLPVVRKKLESLGFVVDTEESANILFELMKTKEYDLIILDDMMPQMSGTEAMQKLKKEGCTIPIIVLTGNNKPEDRERYLHLGFDDYIAKPPTDEEFDRVLTIFIDKLMGD